MNAIKINFLCLILPLIVVNVVLSQDQGIVQYPEGDVLLTVSRNQIHGLIDKIPETNLSNFGFNSREEFNAITYGDPLRVYTIKDSSISFTSTWRVPVLVDNEYRSLLTVSFINGEYRVVGIGAIKLAKIISDRKTDNTVGLLRVYELKSDYLIMDDSVDKIMNIAVDNNKTLSGSVASSFKYVPLKDSKTKLESWNEIIRNIQNSRR